jgi:hypothetical protein
MAGCPYWVPGAKPFITPNQPGEFQLGIEKRMGNLTFCLLDGDHSSKAILSELSALWNGGWMHPAGIVCVDNIDCDPRTAPGIRELYNAELGPTWAIVRGVK